MLDECEQSPFVDQLLNFTRNFDPERVRFVFALRDHAAHRLADARQGDYRWPSRIDLEGLKREHIVQIFDRASRQMADCGVEWAVGIAAINYVVHHARGEPW